MTNSSPKIKKPMPIELQVIRASDFICLDADQHLNFEESKKVLEQLALACQKRGLDRAMVDLRDLPVPEKPRFTDAQLVELVGAFREKAGFSQRQRLAIVHRHDVHGTIRNFISIGRKQGLQVAAFLEFDKGMHWLGKGMEKNSAECKPGIEVPIARRTAKKRATRLARSAGIHRATAPARRSRSVRRIR